MMTATATLTGLGIRRYGTEVGDYQMVDAWCRAHGSGMLPETLLPALGIVVEEDGEAAAALWLYMDNSIGVCWLDCAVTRPGLALALARQCLAEAAGFLMAEAERLGYGACFAFVPAAMARVMERTAGFKRRAENLVMMARRID